MKCFTSDKSSLRKALKEKRSSLSNTEIAEKSAIICDKVYEKIGGCKSVLCYMSHMGEVDLSFLIKKLLQNKKVVCLPICTEDTNIIPSQIDSAEFDFSENCYKIREPKCFKNPEIFPDCCIVPGVGFDVYKNRVGHGKGYYDRFLSQNSLLKIAVCYDFQILNKIPSSAHDIKMDFIISEKRTI